MTPDPKATGTPHTQRSKDVQGFLDKFYKQQFGRTLTHAIEKGICVGCGRPADKFNNKISENEYQIAGFCQKCQDQIFGKNNVKHNTQKQDA